MKKSLTKSAKTVDEAVRLALDEIGKTRSEVTVDIIEEGSGGFLGLIGGKDAVVRVSYDEDLDQVLEDLKTEIEIDSLKEVGKNYDVKKRSQEIQKKVGIEDKEENSITEEVKDFGEKIKEEAHEIKEAAEEIFEDKDEEELEENQAEESVEEELAEKRDY